jgi:Alpha amylase, catalytic domain
VTPRARRSAKKFRLRPHPHLYEINTWAWLEKLSAETGRLIKLGEVPDFEWDALRDLGFDVVWLMGVWQRSVEARRVALAAPELASLFHFALPEWKPSDVVGSPYSVAAYVPDPRIGTFDSLDAVREKLHARGMALFLDFIGNHTALDHPWTRDHPEFYVQGREEDFRSDPASFYRVDTPDGPRFLALGRDPYFPPWADVAQLNYLSPAMRAAEIDELRKIASHCDGVRCDMAMLQLSDIFEKTWSRLLGGAEAPKKEFWKEARSAVPDLILLAEAYWGTERRLLDLGFSFVYDKGLYDCVRDGNTAGVHERLVDPIDYQNHLVRFLENHDEGRWASVFGKERLSSVVTFMATVPGMRLYHQGELEGRRIALPVSLRIAANEPPDPVIAAFFEKILRITKEDVFHKGTWSLLPVTPEGDGSYGNLVVFEWRWKKSWKLIAANLAGYASQGRVHFGDRPLPAKEYLFYDELHDVRYVRSSDELRNLGLFVRREGSDAHLFDIARA